MVLLPGTRASNEQTEQLRTVRAHLQDKVRDDWNFTGAPYVLPSYYPASLPSAPSTWNHFSQPVASIPVASSSASPSAATPNARERVNEHIRQNPINLPPKGPAPDPPTDWRPRYYSDGEDSASDNENDNAPPAFDTPDSVSTDLEARKQRRRRRRQQRFENEMRENIGLAHWSAQRNKWTGAEHRNLAQQDPSATKPSPGQPQSPQIPSPVPTTSTSSTLAGAVPDTDLVIPVAPPLLVENSIRDRINKNAYSDIYTKIILQGRTPSIPISLTDVTRSLVHGWKEEGQWPPKPTPAEPSLVKKNGHPHIKGMLKHLGRPFLKGQGVPVEKGSAQDCYAAYKAHEDKSARPKFFSRKKKPANQEEDGAQRIEDFGPHRDADDKEAFQVKVGEAKRADVNNVNPQAEAVIDWIATMLQERAYRRANESIQDHIQRLKHLIAPHKGESEAWFNTRLAARWQQPNETPYEFGARMKAHHARVCIDNGPSSDEDEDGCSRPSREAAHYAREDS